MSDQPTPELPASTVLAKFRERVAEAPPNTATGKILRRELKER